MVLLRGRLFGLRRPVELAAAVPESGAVAGSALSRNGKRCGLPGRLPRVHGVLVAWDAGEMARQRDARGR